MLKLPQHSILSSHSGVNYFNELASIFQGPCNICPMNLCPLKTRLRAPISPCFVLCHWPKMGQLYTASFILEAGCVKLLKWSMGWPQKWLSIANWQFVRAVHIHRLPKRISPNISLKFNWIYEITRIYKLSTRHSWQQQQNLSNIGFSSCDKEVIGWNFGSRSSLRSAHNSRYPGPNVKGVVRFEPHNLRTGPRVLIWVNSAWASKFDITLLGWRLV